MGRDFFKGIVEGNKWVNLHDLILDVQSPLRLHIGQNLSLLVHSSTRFPESTYSRKRRKGGFPQASYHAHSGSRQISS